MEESLTIRLEGGEDEQIMAREEYIDLSMKLVVRPREYGREARFMAVEVEIVSNIDSNTNCDL